MSLLLDRGLNTIVFYGNTGWKMENLFRRESGR